jgi:hypothetical protein
MSAWDGSEDIEYLHNEIARLRVALEFYATRKNWTSSSSGFALQYDPEPSATEKDRGAIARNALKEE